MLTMPFHLAVADSMPPFFAGSENQRQPVYSPWLKFCRKGHEANSREICFPVKNGRIAGEPIVVVVLIELEGEMRTIPRSPCV
jgi:hypothetical protein